jgi:hypothetical protein
MRAEAMRAEAMRRNPPAAMFVMHLLLRRCVVSRNCALHKLCVPCIRCVPFIRWMHPLDSQVGLAIVLYPSFEGGATGGAGQLVW